MVDSAPDTSSGAMRTESAAQVAENARPRFRYRLGRPILRFLLNDVLDAVAPARFSHWYLRAPQSVRSFLYHHQIYSPGQMGSRTWSLPLLSGGHKELNDHGDPGLRQLALSYGLLETEVKRAISVLLKSDPRPWFIDAGANVGQMSIDALSLAKSVLAIEPEASAHRALQCLFEDIAVDAYKLCQKALSDRSGFATFEATPYGDCNRIVAGIDSVSDGNQQVQTIDLDSLLIESGIRFADVAMLKIDVEGAEALVLAGAKQLLREGRPSLLIELLDLPSRVEIARGLEEWGYRAYRIESGTRLAFRSMSLTELGSSWDRNYCFLQDSVVSKLHNSDVAASDPVAFMSEASAASANRNGVR